MRRLVDKVEDGAGMERLTELVSAAEPYRSNPFTKRRTLLQLKRRSGAVRPLLKAWVFSIGSMLIVGSAIAGTGWWQARKTFDRSTGQAAVTAAPPLTTPAAVPVPAPSGAEPSQAREATASDFAAKESGSSSPKSPPAKSRGAVVRETTASRAAAAPSADPGPSPQSAEEGEDPTLVVRAIRALRSERNPAQAEQLLHQYLRTHPRGALAEDALALLIETASALRSPSAADRATRYLELYPNGRYRATAKRVVSTVP
jgi:hypothetical protein